MTSSTPRGQYNRRGAIDLKPDAHEFWRLVQNRVAQKWSWEEIADEIGCHVDDLIHWANWVYQPPEKPAVRTPTRAGLPTIPARDLPRASTAALSKQFLAWRRAQEGARRTREAMGT